MPRQGTEQRLRPNRLPPGARRGPREVCAVSGFEVDRRDCVMTKSGWVHKDYVDESDNPLPIGARTVSA